jgi:hypothetical protein
MFLSFAYYNSACKMNLISMVSLLVVAALMISVDAWGNIGDGGAEWLPNCDFFGGDIDNVRVPGPQCGRACINRAGCNHFVYSNGVCYLKSHPVSKQQSQCGACDVCGYLPFRFGK